MTSDFDLFDVDEGAGFLRVKPTTMRAWILQSRVPYVKLGRRVFLRRQDLEKLISDSIVPARKPSGGVLVEAGR